MGINLAKIGYKQQRIYPTKVPPLLKDIHISTAEDSTYESEFPSAIFILFKCQNFVHLMFAVCQPIWFGF
jgi:hypothetical protein